MYDIDKLIKEAILEKNPSKREAYRAIKSEVITRNISDDSIPGVIMKLIKTKTEDIEMYQKGLNNTDEETRKKRELILKDYISQVAALKELLPPEVSKDKIEEFVVTSYPNGYSQKEMGKVIKEVKKVYPTADGRTIAEIVKSHIQ